MMALWAYTHEDDVIDAHVGKTQLKGALCA